METRSGMKGRTVYLTEFERELLSGYFDIGNEP